MASSPDCRFCEILQKRDEEFLYEDKEFFVLRDRFSKRVPVHLQIVPKRHIRDINQLSDTDEVLLGRSILIAKELAERMGIAEKGYRLIYNVGSEGGQSIGHVHLHLVGGRQLSWQF